MSEQSAHEMGERRRRREEERLRRLAEQAAAEQAATPPVPVVQAAPPADPPVRPRSRRELRTPAAPVPAPQPAPAPEPEPAPEPVRQVSRRELRAATAVQQTVNPPALTGGIRRVTASGELSGVEEPTAPAGDPVEVLSAESRAAALRAQAARAQAEREEAARLNLERSQAQRLATQRADAERAERERAEVHRERRQREESEHVLRDQAATAERARVEEEQSERDRLDRDRVEQHRIDVERAERERVEAVRLEHERAERARVEAARLAVERSARERATLERAEPQPEPDGAAPPVVGAGWPGPALGTSGTPGAEAPAAGPARVGRLRRDAPAAEGDQRPAAGSTGPVPQWSAVVPTSTTWGPSASALAGTGVTADRPVAAEPTTQDAAVVPDDDEVRHLPPRAHPYTWLHMIVLIVVAFVLGMLIFMVVTQDDGAAGAQGVDDRTVVVALPSDPTGN